MQDFPAKIRLLCLSPVIKNIFFTASSDWTTLTLSMCNWGSCFAAPVASCSLTGCVPPRAVGDSLKKENCHVVSPFSQHKATCSLPALAAARSLSISGLRSLFCLYQQKDFVKWSTTQQQLSSCSNLNRMAATVQRAHLLECLRKTIVSSWCSECMRHDCFRGFLFTNENKAVKTAAYLYVLTQRLMLLLDFISLLLKQLHVMRVCCDFLMELVDLTLPVMGKEHQIWRYIHICEQSIHKIHLHECIYTYIKHKSST